MRPTTGFFKGKAAKVDAVQKAPRKLICGDEYYQLRCLLSDPRHNKIVTDGAKANMYTVAQFKDDVSAGNGGFQISFCDTTDKSS